MNPRFESLFGVIVAPVYTEKATRLAEDSNKKVFKVRMDADKAQVKEALEKLFSVEVKAVNMLRVPGKRRVFKGRRGQRSDYKKAIVTFAGKVDFEAVFGG